MKKKGSERKNKRNVALHICMMAALSFVLASLLGELAVYIVQVLTHSQSVNAYMITLYVIPAFSAVVSAVVIYFMHRTFEVSNTLQNGLNKIADGNYDVKIPYKRLDAFNAVYENFNKMAEELNSVRTLREDFVHDFSHEFKTPIAAINGFANLLLDGELTEEERRDIISVISDESARLSRLAESTLALSKIENQQFVGERREYRLDLQIKDCIILLERLWAKKNITVSSELEVYTYNGDEELMRQVWINLLTNAVKYTPEGGEILVTLKVVGDRAEVSVKDNGIGIEESEQGKIFEKYYRVEKSGNGNGLGLAICKRAMEICGGEIKVESHKGKGATFTVTV